MVPQSWKFHTDRRTLDRKIALSRESWVKYLLQAKHPAFISLDDDDLRSVLVHMVAVTIGCSKSSHLWYSIFQLGELINTYMSGFMVSGWGLE